MSDSGVLEPIQANDIDAELERSLTNEWDAQDHDVPKRAFPVQRMDTRPDPHDGLSGRGFELLPRGRAAVRELTGSPSSYAPTPTCPSSGGC